MIAAERLVPLLVARIGNTAEAETVTVDAVAATDGAGDAAPSGAHP